MLGQVNYRSRWGVNSSMLCARLNVHPVYYIDNYGKHVTFITQDISFICGNIEKCFEQKLYGFKGWVLRRYWFFRKWTRKGDVKVKFIILNRTLCLLMYQFTYLGILCKKVLRYKRRSVIGLGDI